jgi:hypothetical protein
MLRRVRVRVTGGRAGGRGEAAAAAGTRAALVAACTHALESGFAAL